MAERYDVIIIGSGAGGGTLAHRLAPTGKKILILERGDWLPREMENWNVKEVFADNRYISPETWLASDGKPFQPQVHYFVGGATKMFGAALYRLRREDFAELRHYDGISPAWPVAYEEFEPYYTEAERLYQVHGERGRDPDRAADQRALPVPRGLARAAHPKTGRRSGRRRLPSLLRAFRGDAERGGHGPWRLHPLPDLRRISLPRPRQMRRRSDRRPPGDRA